MSIRNISSGSLSAKYMTILNSWYWMCSLVLWSKSAAHVEMKTKTLIFVLIVLGILFFIFWYYFKQKRRSLQQNSSSQIERYKILFAFMVSQDSLHLEENQKMMNPQAMKKLSKCHEETCVKFVFLLKFFFFNY